MPDKPEKTDNDEKEKKVEEAPLSTEELKAMLIASQNDPDDCEMCGS